eukprot:TCONS_00032852-protein
MENIPGLVSVIVFVLSFLILAVWSTRRKRIADKYSSIPKDERFLLASRDIGWLFGFCSMTATFVCGLFVNSTTRSIYHENFASTKTPWALSFSLLIGGLLFAKKIRKSGYVTMLDPLQERYGKFVGGILFLPALLGEVLWVAAMVGMLGQMFQVIFGNEHMSLLVILVVCVVVLNTVFGGLYSVVILNAVQLLCLVIGIWIAIPFALTHDHVMSISNTTDQWVGSFVAENTGERLDHALFMIVGGIPWQVYFQHIISMKDVQQARVISCISAFGCLVMACPAIILGAVAKSTDWESVFGNSTTGTHLNDMGNLETDGILPITLKYLTPSWVMFITLCGLIGAMMSSASSAFLSSASMFSRNIYKASKKTTSANETLWVVRFATIIIASMATVLGLTLGTFTFDLWILSCDCIYVVLFPQLLCAVYVKWVNVYGAFPAIMVGSALRICGGIREFGVPAWIKFPFYDMENERQVFPFRTLAMGCSLLVLVLGSLIARRIEERFGANLSQDEIDILKISYKEPEIGEFTSFSKITRWSGSYNNITASALELRNKGREDKSLLKATLGRNTSACSNRPTIEACEEEKLEF